MKQVLTTPADLELADEFAICYADPLRFVHIAYPWGEPGSLRDYRGPDAWQESVLRDIGAQVRERAFDGVHPVAPLRFATASGHGIGKFHAKSLVINTPDGERTWGALSPGDRVFGADGSPTVVVATHEQGVKPIYRVTFDDGSSTLVGLEHLWNVRGRQDRRRGLPGWRTMSTADILEAGIKRPNGCSQARQWEIPVQGPAQFDECEIDLHPYFVGLWLGDGSKGEPAYTKPFPEIVDRLRSFGLQVSEMKDGKQKRVLGISHLLTDPVFALGSHERYIPDAYKFNTVANREELLRGLLDTDGEVNVSGSIGYSSTSERLIQDVIWLVRSLGGKAMLQPTAKEGWYPDPNGERVECRDCYRATINLPWNPFTHEARSAAYKPSEERYRVRWIDSIEYSHDEDAMCITVAAPDGLYQTNDFIVTHNSVLCAWLVNWIMSTRPHAQGTVTANTFPQLASKTWPQIQRWTSMSINAHWWKIGASTLQHKELGSQWSVSAQTCREENSESFAGQHAASSTSFYIFDESSSVPDAIWEVAEGGLTDGEPMIFAFGNPTRSQGKFHRVTFGSERERWSQRSIDSRDCAFTNKAQIDEWIQDYGEDSDFVRVRVRGLPPAASDLQYIDADRVYGAQKRPPICLPDDPLVAGLDVARGGSDNCVIRFRRGADAASIPPIKIPGEQARDSMRLVSVAADVMARDYLYGDTAVRVRQMFIDETGVGGPIVDRMRQLGYGSRTTGVQFGGRPPDAHYGNMRSWMWSQMRDWLTRGSIDKDARLETDLTGPGYHHDKQDRLLLESKEDLKKRGLDSPDDGDALALTFAAPVGPERKQPAQRLVYNFGDRAGGGWMA